MKNRRKRRDDERRERFSLLYASTFRFDAPSEKKLPIFFNFARNFPLRRQKLASANAFSPKLEAAVDKKSRRSNRLRFGRRRFDVAGRAVGLKSQATNRSGKRTRAAASSDRRTGAPGGADYSAGTSGVSASSASVATGASAAASPSTASTAADSALSAACAFIRLPYPTTMVE